ncbi:hypothetical protein [Polaromonas sp. UBA4122]|uniref:hypothetical protein n=1 Tax=Polaromonas sp. UBA4122 TaxID=1947074 RepID=UPI0025FB86DB|nr:hypothetical protein [Polaromonas sp. UBA4122]
MLAVVTTVKLLAEIALLALFGQGVIGLLSGPARDRNLFYRLLQLVGQPWVRAARWLSPRVVLDRHLPLVAFLVLLFIWGGAAFAKVSICLQIGVTLCK